MNAFLQDIRYAVRRLVAMRGFSLGAVASLALGLGASALVFSAVNGVLLRPLAYKESERLVYLPREGENESDVAIPDVADWRASSSTLAGIAAFSNGFGFDLLGNGEPVRLEGSVAEPDYFSVLGGTPIVGRFYTAADEQKGAAAVAVLGEGAWRRLFGGDRSIVGRVVTLNDVPTTIVGVAPASLDVLASGIDIYAPPASATPWAMDERGTNHMDAIGRLKPGVTLEQARADLGAITRRLAADYPLTNGGKVVRPVNLRSYLVGNVRVPLLILLGAVALVVIMTCINLANTLLARAASRGQELAIRLAMGASRARIARQLLTETLLLAAGGGVLGLLLASAGRGVLIAVGGTTVPRLAGVTLDWRVVAFAIALSLLAAVVVGIVPALQAFRHAPAEALHAGRSSAGGRRARQLDLLAAFQAAVALLLVIGAGLLTRSFVKLTHAQLGFEPRHLLEAELSLHGDRYSAHLPQTNAFAGMVDAIKAAPGIEDAAFIIGPPLSPSRIGHTVLLEDRPHSSDQDGVSARARPIIGDYFHLMNIPLLSGRRLAESDREDARRVVVVNQRFARETWPGASPIGKRLALRLGGDSLIWRTVVGMVGDVRSTSRAALDEPAVYEPYRQRDVEWQAFGSLVVKTRGEPLAAVRTVEQAIWKVDPTVPLDAANSMTALLSRSTSRERFSTLALGAFALGALLIAMQGLYSVMAYAVAIRRREIGIRVALGAEPQRILRLVLARAGQVAGLGLLAGLALSAGLSRVLRSVLYETSPADAATYVAAVGVLALVVLAASWLPARRATRIDPVEVLKEE